MKKSVLSAIAGISVVALSVTPAAAVAVTSLPSGDTMVVSEGGNGVFNFLDSSWVGATRFGPVQNELTTAIAITYNPADGLLYGVNGWDDDESDQQVFSVDPSSGASTAWDIDYGNGDSTGYETRSIAFDGEGNLVALVCQQTEYDPGLFDCPDTGNQQFLVELTLTAAGVADAGNFLQLDYRDDEMLASVAWNPITESFFVLGYSPREITEVAADGSLGLYMDISFEGNEEWMETTDLAFDSDGVAWICFDYCDRFVSLNLADGTLTDVADGLEVEGMTILRPFTALAETGVGSTNLGLIALTAVSALGAGAWFARRRHS